MKAMFTQRRNTSSHERVKWTRVDFSNWHDELLWIKFFSRSWPCQTIEETAMQIHLCSSSLHSNDENHRSTRSAGGTKREKERRKMNYMAEEFLCQPTQCQRLPSFSLASLLRNIHQMIPFPPTSFNMSTCLMNSPGLPPCTTRPRAQLMHNNKQ